jgi:micrococcal nuclease
MWSKLLFLLALLILGFVALMIALPDATPNMSDTETSARDIATSGPAIVESTIPPLTTPDLQATIPASIKSPLATTPAVDEAIGLEALTATLKPIPVPTPSAVPIPTPTEVTPTAASQVEAVVTNVVDEDTIDVLIDGQEYRVRYIGVDTPETVHPIHGEEPYVWEASEYNKSLVQGQTVFLEKDVSETDQFGRLLRYVWLEDGTMVNSLLLAGGYAQVSTFPPDVKYANDFVELERIAREAGVGLWGMEAETASGETPEPVQGADCDSSYPEVCVPSPPPDLDCGEIRDRYVYEDIRVLQPDSHRLDREKDGVGCES